jgi:hypothetical protein
MGSRGLDMFQPAGEGREMDWGSARRDQAAAWPMELIGREPEIQQLRLFTSRLTQGAGEALLLSGDPGVGKTSLLDQAAGIAAASGIRLLRATGAQFEADISFAALHQLLRPCFTELPHLSPLHARALNVALGLGEGPPPAQLLVASAVLALLQQIAKEQPLLLIVDDLPWLDRASALVLGMVARRLAGLPVALLAAGRTGEPSFFDQGNLPVARVEPLSEEAAAELLTSRYPVMTPRVRRRLLDGQPERHAWHLAEATEEPDKRVAALLQEVAHANLRRGDSVGAVTELLRAAELSPSGKGRSGRLAEAAYLGSIVTGDLRDAPRLLEQARRAHSSPGGPLSAAVAGAYHLLHGDGDGDVDTAHRLLTTAIGELDDPRDALAGTSPE